MEASSRRISASSAATERFRAELPDLGAEKKRERKTNTENRRKARVEKSKKLKRLPEKEL